MFTTGKRNSKIVVFIYGFPASGKLTVARELSKKTGFVLFHNHLILDVVFNLYGWESREGQRIREKLYFELTKSLVREDKNIIFTHVFQPNYISSTGVSDKHFVARIKNIVERNGYLFFPVQLICDQKVLLKRVVNPSRKSNSKVNSRTELLKWFTKVDFKISLNFPFNITINNTNLSPVKVANMIINNFPIIERDDYYDSPEVWLDKLLQVDKAQIVQIGSNDGKTFLTKS